MFAVKTQLFSNLPPHEVGKFYSLAEAVAFAETRFQFALEMWIERAGVVVINHQQLRRRVTPVIAE
jgi:hypothetical protein